MDTNFINFDGKWRGKSFSKKTLQKVCRELDNFFDGSGPEVVDFVLESDEITDLLTVNMVDITPSLYGINAIVNSFIENLTCKLIVSGIGCMFAVSDMEIYPENNTNDICCSLTIKDFCCAVDYKMDDMESEKIEIKEKQKKQKNIQEKAKNWRSRKVTSKK